MDQLRIPLIARGAMKALVSDGQFSTFPNA